MWLKVTDGIRNWIIGAFVGIAAASAVKGAAYLDLYQQKALPTQAQTTHGRELLGRIVAMLSRF